METPYIAAWMKSLVVGVLCTCLAYIFLGVDDPNLKILYVIFTLKTCLLLAPLLLVRKLDWFEPIIYIALVTPFFDSATVFLIFADTFHPAFSRGVSPSELISLAQEAAIYQFLGILALYFGYFSRLGYRFGKTIPVPGDYPWASKPLLLGLVISISIVVICYLWITTSTAGDPIAFMRRMAELRSSLKEKATLLRGVHLITVITVIWFAYYLTQNKSVLFWIYLALSSLMLFTLGSRSAVLAPLMFMLIIRHYLVAPLRSVHLSIAIVAVVLYAVIARDIRTSGRKTVDKTISIEMALDRDYAASAITSDWMDDRKSFDVLVALLQKVPEQRDFLYGNSVLHYVTAVIPRFVWPEKRLFLLENSPLAGEVIGAPYQPTSFLMLLYLNFSWPGILFGQFFCGVFLRGVYTWFRQNTGNRKVLIMYIGTLIYLSGGPSPLGVSNWIGYIVPVLLFWLFCRPVRTPNEVNL